MELRVLKYFLTIAEEENITKAAEILHVTQPTLSRQIMQLEDELGVKLFKRSKYCVKLTEDGMYLKKRAEEILSLADNTARTISSKEISGTISIGCTETHSMKELASMMRKFHSIHPGVNYNVYTTNTDGIKEGIEKGTIDIALMTEPVDTSRFDAIHLSGKERWGAIVRQDSELASKHSVSPEDLINKALLLPIRQEVQYTLESWFGKSFQELCIPVRYNLGRNVAVMVQEGIGIGIGFDLFSEYEGLEFIPLEPELNTGSVICWKKNQLFSTVAGSFIDFLRNTADQINPCSRQ
ncbi:MAG: LysR family transcriptional regulator [Spirochaetes bacterium]|uniref:LysR family transcriptional regulator n=1 Tax=Candidatus Ornithospirochaeta stercoravium TaxID=2840897 RepID=A0A9D9NDN4_9SPIO|nr:LysR family transcriptional regulator [Candidatus Ornithospirochaeta stercoravium]